MNDADTQALGAVLATLGLLGLAWLIAAAWIAVDDQRTRAEAAAVHADIAAWEIGRLLQEARDITGQAARERKELPS